MKIPAHWSKATVEEADRDGRKMSFSCWRSSELSEADAHESALAAARRAVQKCIAGVEHPGRYPYGDTPLREEVIERFTDGNGDLFAAVTRNSYGSLVLNTARAMFIDLDFSPVGAGEAIKHRFFKLFKRSAPSPDERRLHQAYDRVESVFGGRPPGSVRVYRTCAGLRCLVTNDLFDPAADATLDLLRTVGADPMYVRLCKAQDCFRARLTPKPWRCGHYVNKVKWPREGDGDKRFDQWLSAYDSKCSGYATCHFLGTLGGGAVHPEIAKIIEVHDAMTKCGERRELA